jgi:hypothetical protein
MVKQLTLDAIYFYVIIHHSNKQCEDIVAHRNTGMTSNMPIPELVLIYCVSSILNSSLLKPVCIKCQTTKMVSSKRLSSRIALSYK